ncbi:hypothetical protein WT81_13800 [Burkholderia stagnalis]|nr:hypothetical protein WT80_14090 [Burkholderia stagnalis]KWK59765.1 hypothetical protein WT81_13800 [Burkholderia stagnalis]
MQLGIKRGVGLRRRADARCPTTVQRQAAVNDSVVDFRQGLVSLLMFFAVKYLYPPVARRRVNHLPARGLMTLLAQFIVMSQ